MDAQNNQVEGGNGVLRAITRAGIPLGTTRSPLLNASKENHGEYAALVAHIASLAEASMSLDDERIDANIFLNEMRSSYDQANIIFQREFNLQVKLDSGTYFSDILYTLSCEIQDAEEPYSSRPIYLQDTQGNLTTTRGCILASISASHFDVPSKINSSTGFGFGFLLISGIVIYFFNWISNSKAENVTENKVEENIAALRDARVQRLNKVRKKPGEKFSTES